MKKLSVSSLAAFLIFLAIASISAQEPAPPPKPVPNTKNSPTSLAGGPPKPMARTSILMASSTAILWIWANQSQINGKPVHTHFILKRVSPDSATFTFDMARGSDPLANIMEGKQTRQK